MLLVPEDIERPSLDIPLSAMEGPGLGVVLGAVVGSAVGFAGGFELAALIGAPVLASVTEIGFWLATIFGIAGTAVGAVVGCALDHAATDGLPQDEFYVYEDALRNGRSLVLAFTHDGTPTKLVRQVLVAEGADSIDKARKNWRIGLSGPKPETDSNEAFPRERASARKRREVQPGSVEL